MNENHSADKNYESDQDKSSCPKSNTDTSVGTEEVIIDSKEKSILRDEEAVQVDSTATQTNKSEDVLEKAKVPQESNERRSRTQFTSSQIDELEKVFHENKYPDAKTR